MPQKIKPTGRQKTMVLVHFIIYAIACVVMWTTYNKGVKGWAYPWPAWITAAWGLSLLGHIFAVYASYEDRGMDEYHRQTNN